MQNVDTDIIFYTDLNIHPETKKFKYFQEELLNINYSIMIHNENTRNGLLYYKLKYEG